MADKTSKKSVMDFDPLAWLDEGQQSPSSEESKVNENEQAQTVAEAAPVEADEANDDAVSSDGYGFFADDSDASEASDASVDEMDDSEQGYGFFDDAANGQLSTQGIDCDENAHIINLGAELTIKSVSTCKQYIDNMLSEGFDIQFDAQQLQKIDSAGLQLLLSLKSTLQKTGQRMTWNGPSSMVNESAALLGLPPLAGEEDGAYGFFTDAAETTEWQDDQQDAGFGFF